MSADHPIDVDGSDDEDFEEKRPVPLRVKFPRPKATAPLGKAVPIQPKRPKLNDIAPRSASSKQPIVQLKTPRQLTVRFVPAKWPNYVVSLRAHYNLDGIAMPFTKHFGSCECATNCRQNTCRNSRLGIFCEPNCCPFGGLCGNGLEESKDLVLVKDIQARSLAVIASKTIPKGVILGQYLGRLTLERPLKDRLRNRGYRLVMNHGPKNCGSWRLCVDAEMFGSILRFVNPSCKATAVFLEVSNGGEHTVVVASTREIKAGEEVTANYGNHLWFICRCGHDSCCHRQLQHLSDS